MSCSLKSPSRPTTPVTTPSREAGTCGDAVLTMARADWPGACTDSSGVPSAAETTDAVPLTGNSVLPGSGVPTVSPSLRRADGDLGHLGRARPVLRCILRRAEVVPVVG